MAGRQAVYTIYHAAVAVVAAAAGRRGRRVAWSLVANANRKAAESFSRARFVACSLSNFGTGTRGGIRQTLSVHYRIQDVSSHRKGKHHQIFKMFGAV